MTQFIVVHYVYLCQNIRDRQMRTTKGFFLNKVLYTGTTV